MMLQGDKHARSNSRMAGNHVSSWMIKTEGAAVGCREVREVKDESASLRRQTPSWAREDVCRWSGAPRQDHDGGVGGCPAHWPPGTQQSYNYLWDDSTNDLKIAGQLCYDCGYEEKTTMRRAEMGGLSRAVCPAWLLPTRGRGLTNAEVLPLERRGSSPFPQAPQLWGRRAPRTSGSKNQQGLYPGEQGAVGNETPALLTRDLLIHLLLPRCYWSETLQYSLAWQVACHRH